MPDSKDKVGAPDSEERGTAFRTCRGEGVLRWRGSFHRKGSRAEDKKSQEPG